MKMKRHAIKLKNIIMESLPVRELATSGKLQGGIKKTGNKKDLNIQRSDFTKRITSSGLRYSF